MSSLGRTLLVIALTLLSAAAIVLTVLPSEVDAQGLPAVQVVMDQDHAQQTGRPTATANDLLLFPGEVTVSKNLWLESAEFELRMEMAGQENWAFNFDPPTMTFQASGTQSFNVTVTVPAETTYPNTFFMWFNATATSGFPSPPFSTITPGSGSVSIAQYYAIGRLYSTLPIKVTQGEQTTFNITLINRGNGEDTFKLDVTNLAELGFAGLDVIFKGDPSYRIAAGTEREVEILLTAKDDAREGTFALNLSITSVESGADPDYDTSVKNGAEWTVVVEPSLVNVAFDYWYLIVGGVVALVVLVLVIRTVRRRKRTVGDADAEDEDLDDDDED